ncbi:MAG: glycoside hydrolase [Actinomycetota bacterium]|nr:glycoside hydrolase [Actinomycetota bacterium]
MASRAWGGAALAAVGIVVAVLGFRGEPARVRAGPTQAVTDDPESAINTNTSPVAIVAPGRPDVMVVAGRVDAPRLNCTVSVSTSAGRAWRPLALPLPSGAQNCFWPDVAFDADGNLLVLFTPTSGPFDLPDSLWLQRFRPDFTPDGPAAHAAGPLTFQPRLAVEGRTVLAAWIQARPERADKSLGFSDPPNPVVVARSDDGGRSFSPPVVVSEPDRLAVQPSVVALPGGGVLVGALDLGNDRQTYQSTDQGLPGPPPAARWRVVSWTSRDGGRTFGPAAVVTADVVPVQRVLVDLSPAPAFAVDTARNRLFATWESGHDVLLSRSDDGGASWSPPHPVGPVPGDQFLPGIAVSPGGRVDMAFYDRAGDPAGVLAEVVVASSADGGRSFTHGVVSDRRSDPTIGSFNGDTVMLGSHLAVVAQDSGSTVVWPDTARGNRVNNIVDLASVAVAVDRGRGAAVPLVAAGTVAALLGLALSVRSWPAPGAGRGRSS